MLIRPGNQPEQVVAEAALPTEAELHEALTNHPELIPTSDLNMGQTVVVGRESGLSAGYADLVLLDEHGKLCIVEVKNEGNPDTRRVVAQLLDYAASLWALSIDEFEQRVLHPFLTASAWSGPLPSVGEYLAEATEQSTADPDALAERVGQALAAGEFALVVVAPQIPVGVQRVLEYLNARGQRLFGLEVSYFSGPVQCFVPRLVVKPLVSDPASDRGGPGMDEETFLGQVPEQQRDLLEGFLTACTAAGGDVLWRKYGPSITVTREQQRQVAYIEAKRLGITLMPSGAFPHQPFESARAALAQLGIGAETKDAWYRNIPLADTTDSDLTSALDIARELVEALVPTVVFAPLSTPLEETFTRNDHNIWLVHVPSLADLHGKHLRGHLIHVASSRQTSVDLIPLANEQPGWRPRFRPAAARQDFWPASSTGDVFKLVVDAAS